MSSFRRATALRLLIGIAISLLVFVGCSGSSGSQDGDSSVATITTNADPEGPPRLSKASVVGLLDAHYRSLNQRQFVDAWEDFTPSMRAELGSLRKFTAGYEFTKKTHLDSLDVAELSATKAVVNVEMSADVIDACRSEVNQSFVGTWTVKGRSDGPRIADATIDQLPGDTVVVKRSECPQTEKPVRRLGGGGNGYGYGGGGSNGYVPPSPPGSGFCDTHDCIPNYPNGNGYTVQCADGTYSQSGGIQGACSGHGGVGREAPEP